jgi:hypothetical protein
MKETKSQGEPGYTYRHFTDYNFAGLQELKRQYDAMAYRTWLNKLDDCGSKAVLTVEVVKI